MDTSDNNLIIKHVVKAPLELVWRAWTEADRLARWWGPKGYKMLVVSLNLHPGGTFHYSMQTPQGKEMWGKFTYREIVRPEKIEFTDCFADIDGNPVRNPYMENWPLEVANTLTLNQEGDETTILIRVVPVNPTELELKTFNDNRKSMQNGFAGTWEQLDAYLAEIQK